MKINNKTYDVWKWTFSVVLPALTTLYITLAMIWGWPYTEQIAASLTAVITCGCTLLGISSVKYQKLNGGNNNG